MRRSGPRIGDPKCTSCGGSGECLTCAGSGRWYAGTADEDECSSCGGSGTCPDCFDEPSDEADAGRVEGAPAVSLPNFSYLLPDVLAGMGFPGAPEMLVELVRLGFRTAVSLHELPSPPLPAELTVHHHPLTDFCYIDVRAQHAAVQAIHQGKAKVVVFCGAGYGRTGVILADYLVSLGQDPAQAIEVVRVARPGSIDHPGLELSVHDYAEYLARSGDKDGG